MKVFSKRRLILWICIFSVGSVCLHNIYGSRHIQNNNFIPQESIIGTVKTQEQTEVNIPSHINSISLKLENETTVFDTFTWKPPTDSILRAQFLDDLPCEMGFQPEYDTEFSSKGNSGSPKIPHIIHQIWIDTSEHKSTSLHQMVPVQFKGNMNTFRELNPSWKYMFWSYANGRSFIERHYPRVLDYFDKAPEPVTKADL